MRLYAATFDRHGVREVDFDFSLDVLVRRIDGREEEGELARAVFHKLVVGRWWEVPEYVVAAARRTPARRWAVSLRGPEGVHGTVAVASEQEAHDLVAQMGGPRQASVIRSSATDEGGDSDG